MKNARFVAGSRRMVAPVAHCSVRPSALFKPAFVQDLAVQPIKFSMRSGRSSRVIVEAVKKSVGDLTKADLEGKRVLVRADLNVPLDKKTMAITDDTRIRAAIPTLKYLLDNGAKVLLTSHLVSSLELISFLSW